MLDHPEGSGPTDRDPAYDTEGHRLSANDDETIESDDESVKDDTEGHSLTTNDNETLEGDRSGG